MPEEGREGGGRVDDFLILVGAVSFARPRIVFLACILVHSSQLESQNSWRLFGSSCSSKFLASVTRHENGLTMLTRLLHKRNPICRLHHACLPSSDLFFREWTKNLEDISFAFQFQSSSPSKEREGERTSVMPAWNMEHAALRSFSVVCLAVRPSVIVCQ